METRNHRGHNEECQPGRRGSDPVAAHGCDDQGIDTLAVVVLFLTGGFFAQGRGRDLKGTQRGTRHRTRLRGASPASEKTWRRSHEREQRGNFRQSQGGSPGDEAPQGTRGSPQEKPQGKERKGKSGYGLAPVVHLGGATPTERLGLRGGEPSHGLGTISVLPQSRGLGRVDPGSHRRAGMAHASSGSHDDAIPGQVKASTHVEAVAEWS